MADEQKTEQVKKTGLRGLRGFSRKSNVAMVAIGGLAAVQQNKWAVLAVVVIALSSIATQTLLDWFDKDVE